MTRSDRIRFACAMIAATVGSTVVNVSGGAPLRVALLVSMAVSAATYGLVETAVWWLTRDRGLKPVRLPRAIVRRP